MMMCSDEVSSHRMKFKDRRWRILCVRERERVVEEFVREREYNFCYEIP